MTRFYLVDVVSIKSSQLRSSFPESEISNLARSFLDVGGLLRPLLLKQEGIESYEVISGHLEYFAAVRAREIDPKKGEVVGAFLVSDDPQSAVKQISMLRDYENNDAQASNLEQYKYSDNDSRITNIEIRFEKAIDDVNRSRTDDFNRLMNEIEVLKKRLPEKVEPLEAFNSFKLNDLTRKLTQAKLGDKTAVKIANSVIMEREISLFISLTDVVKRTKGLGEKRMITIVDTWMGLT